MDYVAKREVYVNKDAQKRDYDTGHTIYTYKSDTGFIAIAFGGRRTKRDWGYRFDTNDKRQTYINTFMKERFEIAAAKVSAKAERKALMDAQFKDIKVGDIFCESGGYDQTNVYFYELVALKGKTGTFRNIQKEVVPGSEGMMSADVVPVPGAYTSDEYTKRIQGDRFKAGYYNAYKTDPAKSHYCSWYA